MSEDVYLTLCEILQVKLISATGINNGMKVLNCRSPQSSANWGQYGKEIQNDNNTNNLIELHLMLSFRERIITKTSFSPF